MSATPATANRPRPSVLNLFDPLNSPARILPSTPERKENITCSPKTSTRTGGHLNLGSETVFFKRTYSRRNRADGETKSKDGVLVDFEDGDGTGESDDEDEPTQQRRPLVELTTNQPCIQNDSSIGQMGCNELVPSVIESETGVNGPSSLDTNPGNALLPETPMKGQLSMPSSCRSSPCESMCGSPTIKVPLPKSETVTSGTSSIPTPSIDDSNSSSTHITEDSVPASSGSSELRDQTHPNGRDSSHEQESGISVGAPETSGSDNVVKQEIHQPAPTPVGEVEVFPYSSHKGSVPPRPLCFEAKPTPDSPPMLTDRPIPVLGKRGNSHVTQSGRRKQDRSIDLHTSIYLTGSDVEASVDLLNDEMSFLANLSDRSVDAAGNMSVMAGFGRKGCKNVFNSTGLDEGARALAIAALVVPKVMEAVPDQRTSALELEELVPHHARPIDEQPKSTPHEVRLPPSPSPHEVALPPSPLLMGESRSRRRENDTIHPNSRFRPTEVCLPPSPPPTYVSVHRQEQERAVSRENSRSQTRAQPHQIQLPPSPTPVFTEMPKQASKLPAARASRIFTAPQNPQPTAPVFTKATTGKEASTTTGMMKPRRSSIAMPLKVVPALAPVRPLVVKKNRPIVQVADVEKGSTAAAPLVRTRSRPSLLSTTVQPATSSATATTTQSTGSAISTETTRQRMSARERLRAGYSRHTQLAPPVSNAGLASSTSSNDSLGATTTKRLGPSGSDLVRSGVQRPPKGALIPGSIVVGGGLAPHTSSSNGGARNNAVSTRVSTTTSSTMPTTTTLASTRLPKPASRVVGSGLPTSRLPAPSASGLKRIAK